MSDRCFKCLTNQPHPWHDDGTPTALPGPWYLEEKNR